MDALRLFLEQITPLSDTDWRFFSSKLSHCFFKKKEVLLQLGQVESYLSFIQKGTTRIYVPKLENDVTLGFAFEGEFVTGYDSFITRQPTAHQIEALSDTTLWRISYQDLQEVYEHTNSGNIIGRRMAENLFLTKSARELSLLNKTAEERYLELFSTRPRVVQHLPLKYVSSYVGVTPQALSRIRKRIS